MPSFDQSEIKKKEFLVAKDGNTGNVVKVVFPNGIQVGIPGFDNFNKGITLTNGSKSPAETTNTLYAINGAVYFNGSPVGSTPPSGTFNDVSNKLSTTGTFSVAGNLGFNYFANNVGTDVNFFVSGSTKSIGTIFRGTANFGGDLMVSGAIRSLEMDESLILSTQVFG